MVQQILQGVGKASPTLKSPTNPSPRKRGKNRPRRKRRWLARMLTWGNSVWRMPSSYSGSSKCLTQRCVLTENSSHRTVHMYDQIMVTDIYLIDFLCGTDKKAVQMGSYWCGENYVNWAGQGRSGRQRLVKITNRLRLNCYILLKITN